jgi:hypothetical protein
MVDAINIRTTNRIFARRVDFFARLLRRDHGRTMTIAQLEVTNAEVTPRLLLLYFPAKQGMHPVGIVEILPISALHPPQQYRACLVSEETFESFPKPISVFRSLHLTLCPPPAPTSHPRRHIAISKHSTYELFCTHVIAHRGSAAPSNVSSLRDPSHAAPHPMLLQI